MTGFIGRALSDELLSSGYEVVGLARRKEGLKGLEEKGLQIRLGDVCGLPSLLKTINNVDAVIHLAAATSLESTDYDKSFLINVLGSQNVIDASRINSIKKVIYLGTQSDNLGAYATTKREAERLFRGSDLDWVVISPSLVYGPGSKGLFASMVGFIRKSPVMPIVGTGNYPMRPIYIGDVIWTIKKCLETNVARREYFISGPEVITYRRFMEEIARALRRKPLKAL